MARKGGRDSRTKGGKVRVGCCVDVGRGVGGAPDADLKCCGRPGVGSWRERLQGERGKREQGCYRLSRENQGVPRSLCGAVCDQTLRAYFYILHVDLAFILS